MKLLRTFPTSCSNRLWVALAVSGISILSAMAAPVELRLVPFNDPAITVDKLEKEQPILNPVPTPRGVEMQKIGVDYTGWARNVRLDGQPIFERYYEGKYIDRVPVARLDLKPGDHTLWPGNHIFTVEKDGTVTSKSPELLIEKNVVKLKCYPVTLSAYLANPPESALPLTMRTAPLPNLTLRDAADAEKEEVRELLPQFAAFAPLTLWLPAHKEGAGYLVHPLGLEFHLNSEGIQPGGKSVPGLQIKGNSIEVPVHTFPVIGAEGTKVIISGVAQLSGSQGMTLYPRQEPFDFLIAQPGPALTVIPTDFPIKTFRVAISDPATGTQRALAMELPERHFAPGGTITARVRAVDATTAHLANQALKTAQAAATQSAQSLKAAQAAKAETEKVSKSAKTAEETEASRLQLEQAQAALTIATERATAAQAKMNAAKADLEARAMDNPLANAPVFAEMQIYGGKEWQKLSVSPQTDGTIKITLPTTPSGVYQLRLGVTSETHSPLSAEQWISITSPEPLGLGLFTQRGRNAFLRGESFWIALAGIAQKPLPPGEMLEVDLIDERDQRLPLIREKIPAIEKQQTFIIQLDGAQSLSLGAGKYRVEAKVGSQSARPLEIQLIEPEPATHFTNLFNGKYNVLGSPIHGQSPLSYSNVVRTGKFAEELAAEISATGYNAFMGMNYAMDRIHRSGQNIEQIVQECPQLGPWESYYHPTGRDRFLNAAVRHNLRFYENLFSQHDAMLPRDPAILDACERYASLETASMRFSPAFKGVCLYDEFYDSGDTDAPRSVVAAFFKAQEMAYREKHPGLTSADATRALDRFTGRPAGQRRYEDLETFRTWARHQDSDWSMFSSRMSGAVKDIAPETKNWTLYRGWGNNGGNLSANGTTQDVFASLDAAAPVMYKDGGLGDRPVFAPMLADILRIRDDISVWTQIHNYYAGGLYGDHLMRQAVFGLSQKIEGLSYFTIQHNPSAPYAEDNRDTVRNIATAMLTPWGDFFLSLERGYRKVAVLYSRESAQIGARKPHKLDYTAEGLWVASIRAGFPADFLYDRQLLEGRGMDYDVIFAPGYHYEDEASPEVLAALKKLVAGGKTVVVENSSRLPIEGIVRLDSTLDEYDDKLGGAFPTYIDFETTAVWDRSEEMTKLLRDFLSKKIPPAAIHDRIVGPDWLKAGQGEYLVIPNFAPTGFTGLHKTLYQAPDQPVLRFPARPPVCYDVFEMKRTEVKTEGDWMSLTADLRHLPGKVYAFLPVPIDKIALEATRETKAGNDLYFRAAVAGPDGKTIDAAFPLEITLTDHSGKVWLQIFRAAQPVFESAWRIPINAPAGIWKLRVRELISGAAAESILQVSAPPNLKLAAHLDNRPVWINDAAQIRKFFAKAPAGTPDILIAIDEEQPWCRPHAEKLIEKLKAAGRPARIVSVKEIVRLANDWGETPVLDGGRMWRGELVNPGLFVDAPLILLGKRYENRLIEALARRDVFPQLLSTHFPAPNHAVINWTRRGLSNQFDTITVFANDDAGLAAGIAALPEVPADNLSPKLVKAAFSADAPRVPATNAARLSTPLRDAINGEDRIRSLDVDPDTGRILVGTFGFGHNLFCFSSDGKLLWKQFLPEHNVYSARWYDGGKRIVAATGQGFFLFLLNGEDGRIFKKFAATEWPNFHQNAEGAVNTEAQITINPPLRQIVIRGLTGLMAIDFDGRKLWFHDRAEAIAAYPKESEQSKAASFNVRASVGNFAFSPDGSQLVYSEEVIAGSTPGMLPGTVVDIWRHTPKILDAKTGELLAINEEDPGTQKGTGQWRVIWPKPTARPQVETQGLRATLREDHTLGPYLPSPGRILNNADTLTASTNSLTRFSADGKTLWNVTEDRIWLSALDAMNPTQTRFYRCDREGLVRCIDLTNGRTLWDFKLPFAAQMVPVGDELIAGAGNGTLARLNADGKSIWQTRLRDHHELSGEPYPHYLAAARLRDVDSSDEFFPAGKDGPKDYDGILRRGIEQLTHGDFESTDAWQTAQGKLTFGQPAHSGKSALQLTAGQLATQQLKARIIPSATYLLEFWYRVENAETRLVTGSLMSSDKSIFTGSKFSGRPGEWTFGRLAIKSPSAPQSMEIGFEAEGGAVSVDATSLRALRFPSANLLANTELHAVEQTFAKDFRIQYERLPAPLRERLMSRNRISAFAQGGTSTAMIYLQEAAFLQNGKLDDVGSRWTYPPYAMAFTVTLTKPSFVSHLVIYLNNAEPQKVYPTLSILANNLETKLPQEAALVRMNHRRFIVVNFPTPIFTDSLKIIPGFYPAHTDSLTEVEVYGPLDGGRATKGWTADTDAMPMLMHTPARVPTKYPSDLTGKWIASPPSNSVNFPAFASGTTVVDGIFSVADPSGSIHSIALPKTYTAGPPPAPQSGPQWKLASVTPTTTPVRYAGRLLAGSADHKLHAVADNGSYLWSFTTGGRIYSSPVPLGDDVFFGSDDGRLYKVDVDSGILIWEFATGGKVRGAPALADGRVFVSSGDGFLYAVNAETGQMLWKSPIAKFTRATPAVQNQRVFLGDESGTLRAFDAATGRELWKHSLGGYVSACPVIASEGIAFANEQGKLLFITPDGQIKWSRTLDSEITGQAIATQTQLLIPTAKGLALLRQSDGLSDDRFEAPPFTGKVLSVAKWRDQLFLHSGSADTNFNVPPRTYAQYANQAFIWVPAPTPPPPSAP